tara:strand:+ start:7937 stop:8566 length:630 start_codon:yes stop_codon:yes gene_type:complete
MSPRLAVSTKIRPNVIILIHGFNSAPGRKLKQIQKYLSEKDQVEKFDIIAPKLNGEPKIALKEINRLIRVNKGRKIYLIGTSLGGFYANYFRAKFKSDFLIVHSINPSWEPSVSLSMYADSLLNNLKTNDEWIFKKSYLNQLHKYETYIKSNLNTSSHNYFLHLSKNDEILKFDKILNFLKKNKMNFKKIEYDTDHRFDRMNLMMNHII